MSDGKLNHRTGEFYFGTFGEFSIGIDRRRPPRRLGASRAGGRPRARCSSPRIRWSCRARGSFLEAPGDAGSPHEGAISYSGSGGSPIFGDGGVEYRLRA